MFKFSILLCICLLLQYHEQVYSQQISPVQRVEVLDSTNLKELYPQKQQLDNIESALLLIEKFLATDDLSLIYTDSQSAKEVKDFIKVFERPENNLFEIAAINSTSSKRMVFIVNLYLYFEKAKLKLYKGSFKIGFDVKQKKVIFPIYNADYISKKYQNIIFNVNEKFAVIYNSDMLKANAYVAKLTAYIERKYNNFKAPAKKLNYVISDGYFNSLEYYGFQNYFNVSQYNKSNNTIIDLVAKGFYKHELVHYIFSEYKLNKFLNEGLATLFSGGKGRFESNPSREWENIRYRINIDESYRSVFDNSDSLFHGAYSHEMYYTSAILLYKCYLKLGDKLFFNQLFERLMPLNNKESLRFIKKVLDINRLSSYLESIDIDTWKSIKSNFDKF